MGCSSYGQKKTGGYNVTFANGTVKKVLTLQEAIDMSRKNNGRYSRI